MMHAINKNSRGSGLRNLWGLSSSLAPLVLMMIVATMPACSIAPSHPQEPLRLYQGSVNTLGSSYWKTKVIVQGCQAGESINDREDCRDEGTEAVAEKDPPAKIIHRMCQELDTDSAMLTCYEQGATIGRASVLSEFISTCQNIRKEQSDIIDCIERAFDN